MDGLLSNHCKCCELIQRRFEMEVRADSKEIPFTWRDGDFIQACFSNHNLHRCVHS
jgi:hypothetical protein